jgi:hypothetical protein
MELGKLELFQELHQAPSWRPHGCRANPGRSPFTFQNQVKVAKLGKNNIVATRISVPLVESAVRVHGAFYQIHTLRQYI